MRTLHLGLRVADLDKSLAFYKHLGYEVVGEVPETSHGHLTMLKLPNDEFVTIELVSEGASQSGLNHMVVQVGDIEGFDADEVTDHGNGMYTGWVTDPDGHRIELVRWPDGHPDGMTAADFSRERD